MSEVTVNHDRARLLLAEAWSKVGLEPATPQDQAELIRKVVAGPAVAFRYILVTGLLGKLTNPGGHQRALQAGCDLTGAYDARSLCHKVIVPFEQATTLNLFGRSNEPLVGKPARHPKHFKDNPQLKNKALAAIVHDLLESAHGANPCTIEAMLVECLRVGRDAARTLVVASVDFATNLRQVLEFVWVFLREVDGGARLANVVGHGSFHHAAQRNEHREGVSAHYVG